MGPSGGAGGGRGRFRAGRRDPLWFRVAQSHSSGVLAALGAFLLAMTLISVSGSLRVVVPPAARFS